MIFSNIIFAVFEYAYFVNPFCSTFSDSLRGMVGIVSLSSSYCSNKPIHGDSSYQKYGAKCRAKRDAGIYSKEQNKHSISKEIHVHLETTKKLFENQPIGNRRGDNVPQNEDQSTTEIIINLVPTQQLVAPNFKIVVRDENRNILSQNDTIALPTCLYTGIVSGIPTAKVSLSTCGGIKQLVRISKANASLWQNVIANLLVT